MSQKREKWDQAGKRKTVLFTDNHGREWTAVKDIFTDTPIGPLAPSGWKPVKWFGRDLIPPPHCFLFNDLRPGTCSIDYERWRQELEAAHSQWAQQAGSYAAAMYGDKAMDALENPPPALLNVMGPKPMPVELIEAMMEGNRWILGQTDKRPPWADDYFREREKVVSTERRFADADDNENEEARTPKREPGTGRFTSAKEE